MERLLPHCHEGSPTPSPPSLHCMIPSTFYTTGMLPPGVVQGSRPLGQLLAWELVSPKRGWEAGGVKKGTRMFQVSPATLLLAQD